MVIIRDALDNPAFFLFPGNRPDTGYGKPDILPNMQLERRKLSYTGKRKCALGSSCSIRRSNYEVFTFQRCEKCFSREIVNENTK